MPHDFVNFPELTNSQMEIYYFESPHKQIIQDIRVKVVKVHDGDTITVRWKERNFPFPIRLLDIDAPELNEGGKDVQQWLEQEILNQDVDVLIDPARRVGKWGRLLGKIFFRGMDMGDMMLRLGKVTSFEARNEGEIPNINVEVGKWL